MRRFMAAALAGVALCVLGACGPVRRPVVPDDDFARIDTDRSGTITWAEWRSFDTTPDARRHFEALDTDHDRQISRSEWKYEIGRSGLALRLFDDRHGERDRDQAAVSQPERDPSPTPFL